eukprot:965456_1
MTPFQWIFVLFTFISCVSNHLANANREMAYAKKFFANDHDRFLHSIKKLQPMGDNLMHTLADTKSGVMFSGVFTNNTVLQREPHLAALYGTCDTTNTSITLRIHNTITQHTQYHSTTSNPHNGDWKILLSHPYPNGGNYILTVQCDNCQGTPKNASIYNVTFGDVYFCSGQSNMNIEVHFTFNGNYVEN